MKTGKIKISRFHCSLYCLQYVIKTLVYLCEYTIQLLLTKIWVQIRNICSDAQGIDRMHALYVRTNISQYGPQARLIRTYYCLTKISIRSSGNFPADFVCLWNPVPF